MILPLFLVCLAHAERLPIKTYTMADGLPCDRVNKIAQDSRGFLWFCTTEGLSRFDGYKFVNYASDQGLDGRDVFDFLETRDGSYWIATANGLWRMNVDPLSVNKKAGRDAEKRFIPYYPNTDKYSRYINAICEDSKGTIWCATLGGVYRLDKVGGDWIFSSANLLERQPIDQQKVVAIFVDSEDSVWASASSGLYRRKADGRVDRYTPDDGLPYQNSIYEDREKRIWAGTPTGLFRLASHPKTHRDIVEQKYASANGVSLNGVFSICETTKGKMWLGNYGGLHGFTLQPDRSLGQVQDYSIANGLSDTSLTAITEDHDGNLWLGTASGGAMRIAANGFTTYGMSDGLGARGIGALFGDLDGEVNAFDGGAYLDTFDGKTFHATKLTLPKGFLDFSWGWNQVSFFDSHDEFWMCTGEGLVRYPKVARHSDLTTIAPKAIYTTRDGLPANQIFRLFEDSRGDIWIGTLGNPNGTITVWERASNKFHVFPTRGMPLPVSAPSAFREDAAGNVWIGLYVGGLARYSKGHFTYFSEADGVPPGFIEDLYLDHSHRMWVATLKGGVSCMKDPTAAHPTFVNYSKANGLATNLVNAIAEDAFGMIYLGTGRGVDKLDPVTGRIAHYTTADGLAGSVINVAYRQRDGSLWFGTDQGLSHFYPQPEQRRSPPPIVIDTLRVAGEDYPISELGASQIDLPKLAPSKNDIEIEFAGLSLAAGDSLKYRYKLEGASSNWSPLTDQRSVNYPNLPPGTYTFLVQAVSSSGVRSESPATVSFTILPPLWQRWWFIASGLLLVGLAIYLIDRYRVARLLELERVRTRIATDLHDDIGASLSRMAILSEVVKQETASQDEASSGMLTEIADSARGLVDSMSDIVWSIDPSKDDLTNLLMRVRAFASDVLEPRGIHWELHAPLGLEKIKLSPDQRRHIYLIFKESINNIAKHSGCSSAKLGIIAEGSVLTIEISDNGRGMGENVGSRTNSLGGNGLRNMKLRATDLGGDLWLDSSPEGTRIRFTARLK